MKHWFQARCETIDEGTDCFICSHNILMDPGGSQRLGSLLTAEPMLVSTYLHQKEVCTANRYTIGADQVCPFNAEGWTGRKLCCLEAWCNNFVSLEYAASALHCPRSSRIPQRTPDRPLIQLRSLDHDLPSHTGGYIMGKKLQTSNLQSQEVKLLPIESTRNVWSDHVFPAYIRIIRHRRTVQCNFELCRLRRSSWACSTLESQQWLVTSLLHCFYTNIDGVDGWKNLLGPSS